MVKWWQECRTKAFVHWYVKVNYIEKGVNPSSVKQIYFSGEYLGKGFKIGVMAGMIALTVSKNWHPYLSWWVFRHLLLYIVLIKPLHFGCQEAIAIGRTFASMKDYQLDGNKEMVALGAMNVVGSMTSCYVATGKLQDKIYYGCYYFLSPIATCKFKKDVLSDGVYKN